MHDPARIIAAQDETYRLLALELSRAHDLQYPARIAFYEAHAANLTGMLAGFAPTPAVANTALWNVARCVLDARAVG